MTPTIQVLHFSLVSFFFFLDLLQTCIKQVKKDTIDVDVWLKILNAILI